MERRRASGTDRTGPLLLASELDTQRLAQCLAAHLPQQIVLGLIGTLGAGKTRLVRALAEAIAIDPDRVQSPTFVLCHQYEGAHTIYHLDTYRLRDADEFLELGVEELWQQDAWTIIEWADRVRSVLPDRRIDLTMAIGPQEQRLVTLASPDEELRSTIERIVDCYGSTC